MVVSITAAASARLRATRRVRPLRLTAMSRGQEIFADAGGKSWAAGASLGGGTEISPARLAIPVFGL